jgi:hypothetical protein
MQRAKGELALQLRFGRLQWLLWGFWCSRSICTDKTEQKVGQLRSSVVKRGWGPQQVAIPTTAEYC